VLGGSSPCPPPGPLARLLILGVRGYQLVLSPALHALGGPGCGCRFTPSCSHYALQALATHGALRGSALSARRLLRCQPWGPSGADPVPPLSSS
jgi:putative membrane protein insertion efficiency factor